MRIDGVTVERTRPIDRREPDPDPTRPITLWVRRGYRSHPYRMTLLEAARLTRDLMGSLAALMAEAARSERSDKPCA